MMSGRMVSNLKSALVALVVIGAPVLACAEEAAEAHGEHAGIPMSVTWQAINFVLYIGILVYFLRRPVAEFFATRKNNYEQALVKADQARKEAERKKHEIEERLAKLENSSGASLATARIEAANLMADIEKQANELAKRLREEANRSASTEIGRAKEELREEMLALATANSKKMLEEKMQDNDQKRLQTEFVEKVAGNGTLGVSIGEAR